MKKFKNDNKGFTLVEMIVVLVILAILAAILVPALLGYIDEAKQKQLVLHGKSVYTAAQAVASELYAKSSDNAIDTNNFPKVTAFDGTTGKYSDKIVKIADVKSFGDKNAYTIIIKFKKAYTTTGTLTTADKHDMYSVDYIYYKEGDSAVELKNGSWESVTTNSETANIITIFEKAASN